MSETTEQPVRISDHQMLGDLMALVVDEFKALPDIWQRMSEQEQGEVIARTQVRCEQAVQQALMHMVTGGFKYVVGAVDSVTFKDGCKAVIKITRDTDGRHELADRVDQLVTIAMTDGNQFMGGADTVKADPDEPGLPFEPPKRDE